MVRCSWILLVASLVRSDLLTVQCLDMNAFGEDAVLGCDFVGIVEKVGKNVTSVKVGDHISGLVWGGKLSPVNGLKRLLISEYR